METLASFVSNPKDLDPLIQLFIILTFLMFLPTAIFMMTSFVRIIITFFIFKVSIRGTAIHTKSNISWTCNDTDYIYNDTNYKCNK